MPCDVVFPYLVSALALTLSTLPAKAAAGPTSGAGGQRAQCSLLDGGQQAPRHNKQAAAT